MEKKQIETGNEDLFDDLEGPNEFIIETILDALV